MPKYDYKCVECLAVHTQQHGMFDAPEFSPCHGAPVIKVFHATPVAFRGDGWGGSHPKP